MMKMYFTKYLLLITVIGLSFCSTSKTIPDSDNNVIPGSNMDQDTQGKTKIDFNTFKPSVSLEYYLNNDDDNLIEAKPSKTLEFNNMEKYLKGWDLVNVSKTKQPDPIHYYSPKADLSLKFEDIIDPLCSTQKCNATVILYYQGKKVGQPIGITIGSGKILPNLPVTDMEGKKIDVLLYFTLQKDATEYYIQLPPFIFTY